MNTGIVLVCEAATGPHVDKGTTHDNDRRESDCATCFETIYSNLTLYFSSLLPLTSFGNQQHKRDVSAEMMNTSLWLVHIPHCEANQVGSLGIDPVAVDRPGGIGDAGSLRIVHICLISVW